MSDRLLKVSTHLSALEESLASRDDQLTTLKYQINDLETENELLKESLQKSRVRRSDTEISELQTLKVSYVNCNTNFCKLQTFKVNKVRNSVRSPELDSLPK